MIEEYSSNPEGSSAPAAPSQPSTSPLDILQGELNHEKIETFRESVFSSVHEMEKLKDWTSSPMASGLRLGLVYWALGQHDKAAEILRNEASNTAVATCLARSCVAIGKYQEAESYLSGKDNDPVQAVTYLSIFERSSDIDRLAEGLERLRGILSPADACFFEGRLQEMRGDALAAINCYDNALARDEKHRESLFRLALNVDLRGEDEEARELYERALMVPPVNFAAVMNLGILYEDMGNYRRAMQCFDLALQASPNNKRARLYRRDAAAALNMYYDEEQERREDKRNKILRTPINDFELSVRSRNCLAKMGVRTLGDLVKKTEAELLSYKNFGETSLTEIKEILSNKNMRLGMATEELMSPSIGESPEPTVPPEELPDPNSPDPRRRPISELDLSVRSRRIVDLLKVKAIGDLANKTESELLACPNFGQTSLNEIRTKLDEFGLALRS